MSREALKEVNGVSRLRPPTKLHKTQMGEADVDCKENANPAAPSLKRKLTEDDLRERLAQRKLNTTMTGSELQASKKRTVSKPDLNATMSSASSRTRSTSRTDLNRTTMSSSARTKSAASVRPTTAAKGTTSRAASAASAADKNKRAAWDIKGRLEDTEKLLGTFKSEMRRNAEQMEALSAQLSERETQLTVETTVKSELQTNIEYNRKELQDAYQAKLDLQNQLVGMQTEHNEKIQDMLLKIKTLEMAAQSANSQLAMSKAECDSLRLTIASQTSQLATLQAELGATKTSLESSQKSGVEKEAQIRALEEEIDAKKQKVADLEEKLREDEDIRKKLHNTIQELKGNIRVFCRCRPFVGDEAKAENTPSIFEFNANNDRNIDITTQHLSAMTGKVDSSKKFSFTFDKTFQADASQGQVFDEISQLVQSALDGYNTCIFAYGQTGSGKTYTMEGAGYDAELEMAIVDESTRGMIPRSVEQIFQTSQKLKEKGWEYEMEATFLEIYNENLRDLLATKHKEDTKYEIKHDAKGVTSVTNLTSVKVRSPTQVYELLRRAAKNRAVAKTEMNERSSRSHSVFQLKLSGKNKFTNESANGLLNLIDLAGSERLNQSGCTGARLKETQHINKSLTHLGDVIAALANKDAHIPYRNSKLTYLLQNSLGGNSKTLMFVNISPRAEDMNETISSLRFATKVNACEIGTAKRQTKMNL